MDFFLEAADAKSDFFKIASRVRAENSTVEGVATRTRELEKVQR